MSDNFLLCSCGNQATMKPSHHQLPRRAKHDDLLDAHEYHRTRRTKP